MSHHSFKNDYSFLAHRRVLEALLRLQDEENIAYGLDIHSDNAKKLIQNTFGAKDSEVYFQLKKIHDQFGYFQILMLHLLRPS